MILPPVVVEREGGRVVLTLEAFEEDGRTCCGIYQITGTMPFGPKKWLRLVREEIAKIETIARNAGCDELRLGGRDWSRVLPGYQPLAGVPNGLVKGLG